MASLDAPPIIDARTEKVTPQTQSLADTVTAAICCEDIIERGYLYQSEVVVMEECLCMSKNTFGGLCRSVEIFLSVFSCFKEVDRRSIANVTP